MVVLLLLLMPARDGGWGRSGRGGEVEEEGVERERGGGLRRRRDGEGGDGRFLGPVGRVGLLGNTPRPATSIAGAVDFFFSNPNMRDARW